MITVALRNNKKEYHPPPSFLTMNEDTEAAMEIPPDTAEAVVSTPPVAAVGSSTSSVNIETMAIKAMKQAIKRGSEWVDTYDRNGKKIRYIDFKVIDGPNGRKTFIRRPYTPLFASASHLLHYDDNALYDPRKDIPTDLHKWIEKLEEAIHFVDQIHHKTKHERDWFSRYHCLFSSFYGPVYLTGTFQENLQRLIVDAFGYHAVTMVTGAGSIDVPKEGLPPPWRSFTHFEVLTELEMQMGIKVGSSSHIGDRINNVWSSAWSHQTYQDNYDDEYRPHTPLSTRIMEAAGLFGEWDPKHKRFSDGYALFPHTVSDCAEDYLSTLEREYGIFHGPDGEEEDPPKFGLRVRDLELWLNDPPHLYGVPLLTKLSMMWRHGEVTRDKCHYGQMIIGEGGKDPLLKK